MKSSLTGEFVGHAIGEIKIGTGTWIGSECRLFKDASVPERTTIASGTFMNRPSNSQPDSVIGNPRPIKVLATDRYLDMSDYAPVKKPADNKTASAPHLR